MGLVNDYSRVREDEENCTVQFTFKLSEEVQVTVDWDFSKGVPYEELEKEARDRLERAGLDRNLEEVHDY